MEQQNKLKESTLRVFHDLFDLMVLNWLWLICSLPLVTIGPATCGLYTACLKMARCESVNAATEFFRGFRQNFRQGLLLSLLCAAVLVVAAGDIWFALLQEGMLNRLYLIIGILAGVLALILLSYTFALQAMFRNTLKGQIANAFKLAFIAPGRTIALWLILLLPVISLVALPPVVLKPLGFLYILAGISGPVYGACFVLRNIFDRVSGASAAQPLPTSEE